jgi:predicted Zn-dependent protease
MTTSCGEKKETPPEVEEIYKHLKSELDEDCIGESINRLEGFQKVNENYSISITVKEDVDQLRDQLEGRYHVARELAREGELERAEKILKDLIMYFPDTDDGEKAERYMQFDFDMFKATQLMMDNRYEEAEQTIREVMTRELTLQQAENAERLLDGLTNAKRGHAISRIQSMKAACHRLYLLLTRYRVENDNYPEHLNLHSLDFVDSASERALQKSLSAIEDYQASKKGFSLTAVGKDSRTRIRITQDGVE